MGLNGTKITDSLGFFPAIFTFTKKCKTMVVKRTFDILENCLKNCPRPDAVCGKYDNQWITFSTEQFARQSELLAMGLMAIGIQK